METVCSPSALVSRFSPAWVPVSPWALPPGKSVEAVARQPEAAGNIRSTMMLGMVLAESTAIYGFVVALIIIFLM